MLYKSSNTYTISVDTMCIICVRNLLIILFIFLSNLNNPLKITYAIIALLLNKFEGKFLVFTIYFIFTTINVVIKC